MSIVRPSFIVGIGGSAGGLVAYKGILDTLPSDTGMAFVIVSHLLPTAHSELASILKRHTNMPVSVAISAMPIRANHVYVCPPNADILIEKKAFKVVSPRTRRNVQVDVFLSSLADAMGQRAISIILSGYFGDGAEGCRRIRAKGGTVFTQDTSADVQGMPLSAQATGCVDHVLPLWAISKKLQIMAKTQRT